MDVRRVLGCLVVALAATFTLCARAEAAKVALVHDLTPNVLQQRTITRLRAELVAAGFEITEIARSADDAREAAEAEPPVTGVFATIVVEPRTPEAADIWVADRITHKTVVRRVQAPGGTGNDVAAILAVRAVELLQACLLESFDAKASEPVASSQPLPHEVSDWMQRRDLETKQQFSLDAGLGVLHSFGGVGPAVLPILGFSYHPTGPLAVGLKAGVTAFASRLDAAVGSISARQEFAMVDVVYALAPNARSVRPIAILGTGAYHLDVTGTASSPYQGRTGRLWAAMIGLGAGAEIPLGTRVSLYAALRALLVLPKPIIRAAGEDVGNISRPSLLGETVVQARF
jgi:hypothetical protein